MGSADDALLRAASILGYAWGGLMLVASILAAIPAAVEGGRVASMALPVALSILSLAGARATGRRRWPQLALAASAAWIAFLVMVPLKPGAFGIALNAAIAVVVLVRLRRFR